MLQYFKVAILYVIVHTTLLGYFLISLNIICFLQYVTFCVIISMVAMAVFLQVRYIVKILVLVAMSVLYLALVFSLYVNLYDNRDFLLICYHGYENLFQIVC